MNLFARKILMFAIVLVCTFGEMACMNVQVNVPYKQKTDLGFYRKQVDEDGDFKSFRYEFCCSCCLCFTCIEKHNNAIMLLEPDELDQLNVKNVIDLISASGEEGSFIELYKICFFYSSRKPYAPLNKMGLLLNFQSRLLQTFNHQLMLDSCMTGILDCHFMRYEKNQRQLIKKIFYGSCFSPKYGSCFSPKSEEVELIERFLRDFNESGKREFNK